MAIGLDASTHLSVSLGTRHGSDDRVWRTVKYEEVYLQDYASLKEAYHGPSNHIHFYDYERPHQALDYRTPAQVPFAENTVESISIG